MIVETLDNRIYLVTEATDPRLDHCWYGQRVKRQGKKFVLTAAAAKEPNRRMLVSKAHLYRVLED